MFSTEIKVEGKYVRGTIKQKNKVYKFFSQLSLGSDKLVEWSEDALEDISEELKNIADKIDGLNNPVYPAYEAE